MITPSGEYKSLGDITLRLPPSRGPADSECGGMGDGSVSALETQSVTEQDEAEPTGAFHAFRFFVACLTASRETWKQRAPLAVLEGLSWSRCRGQQGSRCAGQLGGRYCFRIHIWVVSHDPKARALSFSVHTVAKCLSIAETTRSFTTVVCMARLVQEVHRLLPPSDRTSITTATLETLRLNLADVVASALRDVAESQVDSGRPDAAVRAALIDAIAMAYRTSDLMLDVDQGQHVEMGIWSFGRWLKRAPFVRDWSQSDFAESLNRESEEHAMRTDHG